MSSGPSTSLNMNYLESLPDELLLPILQEVPIQNLGRLCRVSRRLAGLCQDWTFWANRAARDFHFPRERFRQTTLTDPRQRYLQLEPIWKNPTEAAAEAAARGQVHRLDEALEALEYLSPEKINVDDLLATAARNNRVNVLQYLTDYAENHLNWEVDLQWALDNAETAGHLPAYEFLEQAQQRQAHYLFSQ